jgi:hypothetical protein
VDSAGGSAATTVRVGATHRLWPPRPLAERCRLDSLTCVIGAGRGRRGVQKPGLRACTVDRASRIAIRSSERATCDAKRRGGPLLGVFTVSGGAIGRGWRASAIQLLGSLQRVGDARLQGGLLSMTAGWPGWFSCWPVGSGVRVRSRCERLVVRANRLRSRPYRRMPMRKAVKKFLTAERPFERKDVPAFV